MQLDAGVGEIGDDGVYRCKRAEVDVELTGVEPDGAYLSSSSKIYQVG